MRILARYLLPWLVPTLVVLAMLVCNRNPTANEWVLSAVQARSCDAADGAWQTVTLPHRFERNCTLLRAHHSQRNVAWGEGAILIDQAVRDARVYVNGEMLIDFDSMDPPTNTRRALLVPVAGRLLVGEDEILIQLRSADGEFTRIGNVMFGPMAVLSPVAERVRWLGERSALAALAVTFAITLFLVPIAMTRRDESVYRWFLLTLTGSAFYISNFAIEWKPFALVWWNLAIHLALAMSLWGLMKFSHRFLGLVAPIAERRIGVLLVVAVIALAIDGFGFAPQPLIGLFDGCFRIIMLLTLVYLARCWWQQRRQTTVPSPPWFAGAMLLVAALGLVDSLLVFGLIGGPLFSFSMHWGMLYLLILLFVALALRILHALRSSERARGDLAIALAERSAELEAEFSLRREAEQARTLAEERHRIMRDMHDGVGGQLVALIGQAQSGRLDGGALERQLRSTLDDLRLMIDSLDEACADLSVALGMFRQRLGPALAYLPIRVIWHTAHLPDLAPVSPTIVLNVMRIVQEAITNAIKHAQATSLTIDAQWQSPQLDISVRDDGLGIDERAVSGRGLASMRERARQIGGKLEVSGDASGTLVRLQLDI